MAQTNFTPISLYYSTTAAAVPTAGNLVAGELAINTQDGKLFYKDAAGVVQTLASKDANSGTFVNLAYTGTLTGGTGIVNLGSGQFYKDASGLIGIGNATPSTSAASTANNLVIGTSSTSTAGITINTGTGSYAGSINFGRGANDGNANYGFLKVDQVNAYMGFGVGSTEQMRIPSAGGVQSAGSISVGGATPTISGAGITFPATQSASSNANTLDDYEEGTWTPTDGSGAGLTFTGASGYYVKIGKQVTAWAQVTYPVTANTAVARVASYPFTTANEEPTRGGGMLGYKTVATVSTVLIQSNNTIMDFRDSTGNVVTNASISNGNFYFAFTYYTA
jgi:hypothetical protein